MAAKKTKPDKCLLCESTDKITRGLCDRHYRRFNAKYAKLTETKGSKTAEEFERLSLEKGVILPKSKGGKPKEYDPFDVLAEIACAETSGNYSPQELAKIISEGDEMIRLAKAQRDAEAKRPSHKKAN